MDIIPDLIAPIPFLEDFTGETGVPNFSLWEDRLAYVNTGYPINPPSIGVVTFDGLNDEGLPYEPVAPFYNDFADKLTSRPFCMADYAPEDSLHLSFFYQPQGLGDYPNPVDSLMLHFLDEDMEWNTVWAIPGRQGDGNFVQVILPVKDPKYFHNDFRFRFENKATVTGLNDHWHIDLIRFDKERTMDDLFFSDVAFASPPQGLLENYTAMPWNQFYDYQDTERRDIMEFYIRTFDDDILGVSTFMESSTTLMNTCVVFDSLNLGQFIFTDTGATETWNSFSSLGPSSGEPFIRELDVPAYEINCDSEEDVIVRTSYLIQTNDTTKAYHQDQIFSNYYAYDDGEAERGYGLFGGNAQLAHKFETNEPDVLRGISVNFVNVVESFSDLPFNLAVWKSIDEENTGADDEILYQSETAYAKFTGVINGFATYRFDLPEGEEIEVDGTFYVGLIQDESQEIIVGFDKNNNAKDKIWYNTSGQWFSSIYDGALMLRPLLGCEIGFPTSVEDSPIEPVAGLAIYPNPTQGMLEFQTDAFSPVYHTEVIDLFGRIVHSDKSSEKRIDLVNISAGMYILRVRKDNGELLGSQKFIKN